MSSSLRVLRARERRDARTGRSLPTQTVRQRNLNEARLREEMTHRVNNIRNGHSQTTIDAHLTNVRNRQNPTRDEDEPTAEEVQLAENEWIERLRSESGKYLRFVTMACFATKLTPWQEDFSTFFAICKTLEMHPRAWLQSGPGVPPFVRPLNMLRDNRFVVRSVHNMGAYHKSAIKLVQNNSEEEWEKECEKMEKHYYWTIKSGDLVRRLPLTPVPPAIPGQYVYKNIIKVRKLLWPLWVTEPKSDREDTWDSMMEWMITHLLPISDRRVFQDCIDQKIEHNKVWWRAFHAAEEREQREQEQRDQAQRELEEEQQDQAQRELEEEQRQEQRDREGLVEQEEPDEQEETDEPPTETNNDASQDAQEGELNSQDQTHQEDNLEEPTNQEDSEEEVAQGQPNLSVVTPPRPNLSVVTPPRPARRPVDDDADDCMVCKESLTGTLCTVVLLPSGGAGDNPPQGADGSCCGRRWHFTCWSANAYFRERTTTTTAMAWECQVCRRKVDRVKMSRNGFERIHKLPVPGGMMEQGDSLQDQQRRVNLGVRRIKWLFRLREKYGLSLMDMESPWDAVERDLQERPVVLTVESDNEDILEHDEEMEQDGEWGQDEELQEDEELQQDGELLQAEQELQPDNNDDDEDMQEEVQPDQETLDPREREVDDERDQDQEEEDDDPPPSLVPGETIQYDMDTDSEEEETDTEDYDALVHAAVAGRCLDDDRHNCNRPSHHEPEEPEEARLRREEMELLQLKELKEFCESTLVTIGEEDPILSICLREFGDRWGLEQLATAIEGATTSTPMDVYSDHFVPDHVRLNMNPPKLCGRNSFSKPGEGFVMAAKEFLLIIEIFLVTAHNEGISPDRYNWDFVLVKLVSKLRDAEQHSQTPLTPLDKSTIRFCKLCCLMLSGRTKDYGCIKDVVKLYKRGYMNIEKMARASRRSLKNILYHSGFHRKRATFLSKMAQMVMKKWKGKLPDSVEGLTSFDGVGRKTAIITLNEAFGLFAGMGCDVHVVKCCLSLFLVGNMERRLTPSLAESSLMTWVEEIRWPAINKLFGSMGQLFTQVIPLGRSRQPDPCVVAALGRAAGQFIHQEHHCKMLWCIIASIRRQYKWGRERQKLPPSHRITYRGTPEGDTEAEDSGEE